MMLKIKKSKVKISGAVFVALLFCVSYVGISFYSIPEKAIAVGTETRTLANIKYMQEMNKFVCENTIAQNIADEFILIDLRDDSDYTVKALSNGKCWMTQNLRLAGGSKLTSADSDVSSLGYTLPATASGAFSSDNSAQQMSNSVNNDYGAYYSFNAATANSAVAQTSGDAPYDICPKGWRLPTGAEYTVLYNSYPNASSSTGWTTSGTNGKAGRYLNAASGASSIFFPAAGYVDSHNASAGNTGAVGSYRSSMTNGAGGAYIMSFASSYIGPSGNSDRHLGYSVRCVANEAVLESENLSGPTTFSSGSIAVKVANTLSIDAVSGMEEEVDSTSIANGTITATIAANTNYKVLLSAEKTSLTSTNTTNTAEIPASSTVTAGTNAWGIRNSDNTTYSAITNQEKEYHNTTALSTNLDIPGTVHTFNIGISVSPSLPADTYSTEVTITAAAS